MEEENRRGLLMERHQQTEAEWGGMAALFHHGMKGALVHLLVKGEEGRGERKGVAPEAACTDR